MELINIETKEDSPEKIAQLEAMSVPDKYVIFGANFNALKTKINDIIAFVNKRVATLANPNDIDFPTTKAVAEELAKRVLLDTMSEYVCTAVNDVNNLDSEAKACILVKNSINLTGIKTTPFSDGQVIIIKNDSTGIVNVMHNSGLSLVGNRFQTVTGQNLSVRPNSWVYLRYSKSRQRIEQISVFGQDVLYSLVNSGNDGRVVVVQPDGTLTSDAIMEYEVHDEAIAPYNTLASIVAAYPTVVGGVEVRKKGFQVICAFSNPPAIYKKCGDGNEHWLKITNGSFTKLT